MAARQAKRYGKIGDCEQSNLVQTCSAFLKFRLILFAEGVLISAFFPGGTPLYKPYHLPPPKGMVVATV